jgi:non-specific serine/threonine protein kinase
MALSYLAGVVHAVGVDDRARELCEEALALLRKLGDLRLIGSTLVNLSRIAHAHGDLSAARPLLEESVAIARQLGDRGFLLPTSLLQLALVISQQGEHASARPLFEESLMIVREIGDQSGMAASLEGLAGLLTREGALERAARLYGAASALRDATGAARHAEEQTDYTQQLASLRAGLAEDAFEAAFTEGRGLLPGQVAAEALPPKRSLTPRSGASR